MNSVGRRKQVDSAHHIKKHDGEDHRHQLAKKLTVVDLVAIGNETKRSKLFFNHFLFL